MMKRREFMSLLGCAAAVWPLAAQAQRGKLARIGALVLTSADGTLSAKNFEKDCESSAMPKDRTMCWSFGRQTEIPIVCPAWPPTGPTARRHNRGDLHAVRLGGEAGDNDHSDRYGSCCRSGRRRARAEPGAPGREHHRLLQHGRRDGGKERRTVAGYAATAASCGSSGQPGGCIHEAASGEVHLAGRTDPDFEIAPVAMARGPDELEAAFARIATREGASRRCSRHLLLQNG